MLVHGNELLAGVIKNYDKDKQRGQADHHFGNIVTTIETLFPQSEERQVYSSLMVGYLVFDALVGNTDRHHENWGFLLKPIVAAMDAAIPDRRGRFRVTLAPTFDHGSSLGRELLEEKARLLSTDPAAIQRYVRKARGGIFRDSEATKGMSPMALAELLAQSFPGLFGPWREHIQALPPDFARPLLESIPVDLMSQSHRDFVLAFLCETRKMIISTL